MGTNERADSETFNIDWIDYSGGSNGEFITITPNEDRVNIREDMGGNASISVLPNHSATVTCTLFPESQSAKKLLTMDITQREIESNNGNYAGVLPLTISDKSGTTLLFSPNAILTKTGDVGSGKFVIEILQTQQCNNGESYEN